MAINPDLVKIDSSLYRVAVKAIIKQDGKYLVVHEIDGETWDMPGGGIDYGEPILESLARELEEEIGVSREDIVIDKEVKYIASGTVVDGIPRVNIFFSVTVDKNKISTTKDVDEFRWMTLEELKTTTYSPSTIEILAQL